MSSPTDWPKWPEMNWLRLQEGPHSQVILPMAPTMKDITYKGVRYFRMPDSRATQKRRVAGRTEYGGCYLWDGWWDQMLAEARAKKTEVATKHGEDSGDDA